jgi:hypothetical protein
MSISKGVLILMLGAGLVLCAWISPGHAQQATKEESASTGQCPKDQVWELPHIKPTGEMAPGFCRPAQRKGFRWIEARKDIDGKFRRGYWIPARRPPADQYWIRGHYGINGKWVEGYFITRRVPTDKLFGGPSSSKKSDEPSRGLFGR